MAEKEKPYFLDLNFNGSILLDPKEIGNFDWPIDTTLLAGLNADIQHIFFKAILKPDLAPHNQILRSCFDMVGVISHMIYNYALIKKLSANPVNAFHLNLEQPIVFAPQSALKKFSAPPLLKDQITTLLQRIIFRIFYSFRISPKLTLQKSLLYHGKLCFLWLIRNPVGIFRSIKVTLSNKDEKDILRLAGFLHEEIISVLNKRGLIVDASSLEEIRVFLEQEIIERYVDYQKIRLFCGKFKFDLCAQSLTTYVQSIFSTISQQSGGKSYSSFHGSALSADEPDLASLANSDVFCAINDAFAKDAEDLKQRLPIELAQFETLNLKQDDYYKHYLRDTKPRSIIKHVAIMGRSIISRVSAFNACDMAFYFDLEKRLSDLLLAHGYEVSFKAHPEANWTHFDQIFDPRVNVEWAPFSQVIDNYDAAFFHFSATSTLAEALGSGMHIFYLQDGWHNIRSWPPRLQKRLAENANPIEGKIGKNGFLAWNEKQVLNVFKNPKDFTPEQRIKDWFNKI